MPAPSLSQVLSRKNRVCRFEIKGMEEGTDEKGIKVATIKGYASVFGKVDWYEDVVNKGAFTKTLAERPKVKVLWQHDHSCPIGKPGVMREDDYGLYVEFDLNLEVEKGREAYALLKQGAIDGLSIGFETIKDEMNRETGIRQILEVRLWEFSVVTFQAQEAAMAVDVRSMSAEGVASLARFEKARLGLKELGPILKTALDGKKSTEAVQILDAVINELMSLRETIDGADDEGEEPGNAHSADEELEVLAAEIELLKVI
jgi:uncharacterized protein